MLARSSSPRADDKHHGPACDGRGRGRRRRQRMALVSSGGGDGAGSVDKAAACFISADVTDDFRARNYEKRFLIPFPFVAQSRIGDLKSGATLEVARARVAWVCVRSSGIQRPSPTFAHRSTQCAWVRANAKADGPKASRS